MIFYSIDDDNNRSFLLIRDSLNDDKPIRLASMLLVVSFVATFSAFGTDKY